MGAPKQKWTAEEEAALKAGVLKHGPGKWRTILKDPQFSGVLYLRSNVDLKDKWRNMSAMANGWGCRERARLALRRHSASKPGESSVSLSAVSESDEEMVDVTRPQTGSGGSSPNDVPKGSIMRLEILIMEAINNLREPGGSSKRTIGSYIELALETNNPLFSYLALLRSRRRGERSGLWGLASVVVIYFDSVENTEMSFRRKEFSFPITDQYWAPPNFTKILSGKLKQLCSMGKLIKIKRRFKIAPLAAPSLPRRMPSNSNLEARRRRISARIGPPENFSYLNEEDIDMDEDWDLSRLTPAEAAAAAARAVAKAEEAMAAAEEALREAEAAEAEAEAAEAYVQAALRTMRGGRKLP
ncbi:telomere repeat binding factor 1 [Striga asiatica]|uniref:MYB transcription factor n=1 Tax=Striga asiatica TaxID=4170 RepID=A0A5A7QG47_STRAF|nr:telomere repeat binding factor 1 [Striga asiatica]